MLETNDKKAYFNKRNAQYEKTSNKADNGQGWMRGNFSLRYKINKQSENIFICYKTIFLSLRFSYEAKGILQW